MLLILVRLRWWYFMVHVLYVSIGNDGSAFVEALVSRSCDDGDKFEVNKSMSCFMYLTVQCDILYCGFYFSLDTWRCCWSRPVSCHQLRANHGVTPTEWGCLVSINKIIFIYVHIYVHTYHSSEIIQQKYFIDT